MKKARIAIEKANQQFLYYRQREIEDGVNVLKSHCVADLGDKEGGELGDKEGAVLGDKEGDDFDGKDELSLLN